MGRRVGFLVTHGTDTMAWSLAYLTYHLEHFGFNIALTGAQRPMGMALTPSDGYDNVSAAVSYLCRLQGPAIFCTFNRGTRVFYGSLTKADCWADDAFQGLEFARREGSRWLDLLPYGSTDPASMHQLHLLATGGTIESTLGASGTISVGDPVVASYIVSTFPGLMLGQIPWSQRIDSSDTSPDWWRALGAAIADHAHSLGLRCEHDGRMSEDVRLISPTPLDTAESFDRAFAGAAGIVLAGYGMGNISRVAGRSPLDAIRAATRSERYVPVVLGSQTTHGTPDFLYDNGWAGVCDGATLRAIENGEDGQPLALPAGDFGLARAQIKLATILGHRDAIVEAASQGWPVRATGTRPAETVYGRDAERRIIDGLFLSGMGFADTSRTDLVARLRGVVFPPRDLLIGRTVEEAIAALRADQQELLELEVIAPEGVSERSTAESLRKRAALVKPDETVGNNLWGFATDAGHYAERFVTKAFGWPVDRFDTWSWGARQLEQVPPERLAELVRRYDLVMGEGGNQSVHQPSSFTSVGAGVPRQWWIRYFRALIRVRGASLDCAPGVFFCLSHQLYADALLALAQATLAETDAAALPADVAAAWAAAVDPFRNALDRPSCVKKVYDAGGAEHGLASLCPYLPTADADPVFVALHRQTAEDYEGYVENILRFDDIAVAMMHGDEVHDVPILALNAFYQAVRAFWREHAAALVAEDLPAFDTLPVAVEITSSTLDANGEPLTEVASMAVYFQRDGRTWRDFTFQFHPEIPSTSDDFHHALPPHMGAEIRSDNDGHKLLLGAVMTLLAERGQRA